MTECITIIDFENEQYESIEYKNTLHEFAVKSLEKFHKISSESAVALSNNYTEQE